MGRKLSLIALALALVALCAFAVAPALASEHVSEVGLSASTPGSLSALSLESTGDAGLSHGNRNLGTSPIAPDADPAVFEWFNQDVRFFSPGVVDPDATDDDIVVTSGFWQFSTDNATWGAHNALTGADFSGTGSAEGLYAITASGNDAVTDAPATGVIMPAFGIDKTKPVSTSNAVPIYAGGTAVVTISAHDALSGVENLQYSVDGAPLDWSWDADPGVAFTVPINFTTGAHTLTWHAFDNAGNVDTHSVHFIVRPLVFVPSVTLSCKPGTGSFTKRHTVKFSGTVSPLATSMPLTITVQRRYSGAWHAYMTYRTTVAAFKGTFSISKLMWRVSTFRARVSSFGGGVSSWHTFVVR